MSAGQPAGYGARGGLQPFDTSPDALRRPHPNTSAKVQVLPSRLDAPQSPAGLTQSDAQALDPTASQVPGTPHFDPLHIVDGTGSDQLADGTGVIIHLHTNPQHTLNAGANLVGDALVTTTGETGVMVMLLCPAASAATCLPALLPYVRTINLTVSS